MLGVICCGYLWLRFIWNMYKANLCDNKDDLSIQLSIYISSYPVSVLNTGHNLVLRVHIHPMNCSLDVRQVKVCYLLLQTPSMERYLLECSPWGQRADCTGAGHPDQLAISSTSSTERYS